MSEHHDPPQEQPEANHDILSPSEKRLNELDELQQQVAKRLKDNQRFLDRFMDDDYEDEIEKDLDEADDDDEPFEEL